jgi:hypothetical protein
MGFGSVIRGCFPKYGRIPESIFQNNPCYLISASCILAAASEPNPNHPAIRPNLDCN